jgi:EAL domain-containing protein (putative c-di-GMP-specific phosphodiesterase class I)
VSPHWFYIPVLLAGGRFGPRGVLTAGLTAGVLAGPLTPADVSTGQAQAFSDWGTRSVFFVIVGLFFAHVVGRTRRSAHLELEGLRLGSELAGAADRGELVLEYQPVVALRQREVIAAEALVRWEHPDRGRVMPDQFIPQSESSGEIHPLGAWVIDEACRQFAQWRKGALDPDRPFRLSVNVSIHQVEDGDLAAVVERALRRHRIPANGLVLELTETAILTEHSDALRQLDRMRALGVLIAVDDFGTGYSSLARLKELPAHTVKVDRAFVTGIADDPVDFAVARAVVDMAHAMGRNTVAEGVETAEQFHVLRGIGVDAYQGWLFSRPLPPEKVRALLATGRLETPAARA